MCLLVTVLLVLAIGDSGGGKSIRRVRHDNDIDQEEVVPRNRERNKNEVLDSLTSIRNDLEKLLNDVSYSSSHNNNKNTEPYVAKPITTSNGLSFLEQLVNDVVGSNNIDENIINNNINNNKNNDNNNNNINNYDISNNDNNNYNYNNNNDDDDNSSKDNKLSNNRSHVGTATQSVAPADQQSFVKQLVNDDLDNMLHHRSQEMEKEDINDDILFDVLGEDGGDEEHQAKRTAIYAPTVLWSPAADGHIRIPYRIREKGDTPEESFTSEEIFRLEIAIESFNQALNCDVKPWIPRSNESEYIEFQKSIRCTSYIGKKTQVPSLHGVQPITISSDCIMNPGKIIHEMMHILGYLHEHMRFDRDKFINIHHENIKLGYEQQFVKIPPEFILRNSKKYDYDSIMQYKENAFSRDADKITIETLDPVFQKRIGQRKSLSKFDLEDLNRYFKCPATRTSPPKPPPVTKQSNYLAGCDFESIKCENTRYSSNVWEIYSDSRCFSHIPTCPQLANKGLCTLHTTGMLMAAYCGLDCHKCRKGRTLMLKAYKDLGIYYNLVDQSTLVAATKCDPLKRTTLVRICVSFDFIRRAPVDATIYDSVLVVYTKNLIRRPEGFSFTYKSPDAELPVSAGNEKWATFKKSFDVQCADTLAVLKGQKKADKLQIDNIKVTAGECQ